MISRNGKANGSVNGPQPLWRQLDETIDPETLAEIWRRRAYALAEMPPAAATGQTLDLLIFWLGHERYGIEVSCVREIYPLEQFTPIPRTPAFSVGVFSARGRILSIVDLKAFFGMPPLTLDGQTKIIVVSSGNSTTDPNRMEIGILASEVADVATIFKEDIEPPLISQSGLRAEYLHGVTRDLLVVLNLNTILGDERLVVYEEML
jgi:purine-binding chemotaxis protein CheW